MGGGITGRVSQRWPELEPLVRLVRRMKPVVKWSVRFGLALTTLLLLVPLATLSRVDHTPFRDLPAWQDTAARLQELRTGTNVVVGELRAGFGRARLTPTLGAERDEPDQGRFRAVPLAGYGARQGRPATGVHQELWVKAVAFAVAGQTGVMVSAAALIPPLWFANRSSGVSPVIPT